MSINGHDCGPLMSIKMGGKCSYSSSENWHHGVPDIGVSNLAMEKTDMKNIEVLKDLGDITYPRVRSHQRTDITLKQRLNYQLHHLEMTNFYVVMT